MNQVIILLITCKDNVIFKDVSVFLSPFDNVIIHSLSHLLTSGQRDDPQSAYRDVFQVSFCTMQHWFASYF